MGKLTLRINQAVAAASYQKTERSTGMLTNRCTTGTFQRAKAGAVTARQSGGSTKVAPIARWS